MAWVQGQDETEAAPLRGVVGRAGSTSLFDLDRWAPSVDAGRFVEHFWSVSWDLRGREPLANTVITFPSLHITHEWGSDSPRHGFSLPNTLVHGVVERVFRTTITERGTVVGARFRPGGFAARFGRDAADLTGGIERVDDDLFAAPIHLEDDVESAVAGLDAAIAANSGEADPTYSALTGLVDRMRDDDRLHRVEQVMQLSPWSARTTQRVFRRYVGVPVKWVLCRYRLQQAALEIESHPGVDFADLVVRLGWYDQAHFINDFRSMPGSTPGEYAHAHGGQVATLPRVDSIDIAFAGAAEQARMLAAGTITAPALVDLYLDRIARLDPGLRAYRIVMAESARQEATAAQVRLDTGERLPLLGVPIAIKDDVDIAGEVTTYGTAAHGPAKTDDAEVVRKLRAGGAVIVGKTTVPEMMLWSFTETVAFGATRNPWNTDYAPGGSSGGSGAAVAAGLASMALGSDGMGSIRIPSTWCGLFGIKPQRDRVPLAPHDGAWNGLSVNGPMARTVEDAALFLDVTTTMPAPDGGFVAAAGRAPRRLRIALSTKLPPLLVARIGRAQRAAVQEAGELLRELGHDVVERDPDYPTSGIVGQALPRYFRGVYDDVQTLPHPERLEGRTREFARMGGLFSDRRMNSIRAAESQVAKRIQSIFDDFDVVITPGTAAGPSRIGAYQRRGAISTLLMVAARVPFQALFNVTGQPAAVVPWGLDGDGIPTSIQLVCRPFDEATLLSLGAQIEKARPWAQRRPEVS